MPTNNPKTSPAAPKKLDQLKIPGMTTPVPGYDGGVFQALLNFGLTVQVDKNWNASTGDVITLVTMPDLKPLATKKLEPGDEQSNSFFFTIDKSHLPDGEIRLGYEVRLFEQEPPQYSNPLSVLIKTDLPGGVDKDHVEPGHSELKFSLSTKTVYPQDASRGVKATFQPYPNMHRQDVIYLAWGDVLIPQQVAGVGQETTIQITHGQLVDAGDGINLPVEFKVVDIVGNESVLWSNTIGVLVDLDGSKLDPPAFITDGPQGYIELERLNGDPQKTECYSRASEGLEGDMYDITVRAYPPMGGVVVYRDFKVIERAGAAEYFFVPYHVVRAAAGGKLEASFVLRRLNDRPDLFSKKIFAQVVGSIVRLEAPFFQNYLNHKVNPIPDSAVVEIPWYDWRKPTDHLTLIMRQPIPGQETIVHSERRLVGSTWPSGSPVKRLIYREALEKFEGYTPELYYVYEPAETRTRSMDLNESIRQPVEIGTPKL